MTPKQIELVQGSFKQVAEQVDETAALFYENLFRVEPQLRPLFKKSNMHHQGQKLIASLAIMIFSLDQPEEVPPSVRQLGVRHNHHGVPAAVYISAQEALLQTIAEMLDEQFTLEIQKAWEEVLERLTKAMIPA